MLVPSVASIPIRSLSAGARHSAYVLSTVPFGQYLRVHRHITGDGRVFAFGNNRFGQLGVDPATTAASADPIHIAALDGLGVKQIQCGWHHCVVLTGASRGLALAVCF